MMETIQQFVEFAKPYLTVDNLIIVAGVLDIAMGALPNSWVKYPGIILSIAKYLKDFDVKKAEKVIPILIVCLLMAGCALPGIMGAVAGETAIYMAGKQFAAEKPGLCETAVVFCDTIIESDDPELIEQCVASGIGYLSANIKNDDAKYAIGRLRERLWGSGAVGGVEIPIDVGMAKTAAQSFRAGILAAR